MEAHTPTASRRPVPRSTSKARAAPLGSGRQYARSTWIAQLDRLRRQIEKMIIEPILRPIPVERRALNRARWITLPRRLQVAQQALGASFSSCGATHGLMERCDLACTVCYLDPDAQRSEPASQRAAFEQLEHLRRLLGPQGKCQITGGEVTLLAPATLGRIISYACAIGLDPMLMTNGRRLLTEPRYLEHLVADHGLGKIAIHVDTTQRGRPGWHEEQSERELDSLRDQLAALVRDVRKLTGRTLHAAHTVTVTPETLEQVPGTISWMLDNVDAFRLVSLQPAAQVGRTDPRRTGGGSRPTMEAVWRRVCEGAGVELNRHAMYFGHPECTILVPLVVVRAGSRRLLLEVAEPGYSWDLHFLRRFLRGFGGFSTTRRPRLASLVGVLSLLIRNPLLVLEAPFYGAARAWRRRQALARIMIEAIRSRGLSIRPLAIVVHRFMEADELLTSLGQERLAACAFKLCHDGRSVSMCDMNAGGLRKRTRIDQSQQLSSRSAVGH